jgi:hypothetical protein
MTAPRKPDFDLKSALGDRGFTPRVRDVPHLLEIVAGGGELLAFAERAVVRVGGPAGAHILDRARVVDPKARARLVSLAGRLAAEHPDSDLCAFLIDTLGDTDEKTRRNAAIALGKLGRPEVDAALAQALDRERSPQVRRSLVEALGKTGSPVALEVLRNATMGDSREADLVRTKALLMTTRTLGRQARSEFAVAKPAPEPILVTLRCRAGLEAILTSELDAELSPKMPRDRFGPGRVQVMLTGAPERLFQARTLLSFGFQVPAPPRGQQRDASERSLEALLIDTLTSAHARRIFAHWTEGPVRYRIAWAQGGKRRASIWQVASEVARRHPELVNDPTDSTWEAVVHEAGTEVLVELVPRVADPRFSYRRADVPASSHPTIAAALVRIAGGAPAERVAYDPGEVVWDPFVGSGAELCERALSGPYRLLIGSDRDETALAVAQGNLTAAGAHPVKLFRGDAVSYRPPTSRPTLILTNPPMGRRVLRGADLGAFLEQFLEHASGVLAPNGRLIWISPLPRATVLAAERLGLAMMYRQEVDMGGFAAEIQALRKGGAARAGGAAPNTRPVVR